MLKNEGQLDICEMITGLILLGWPDDSNFAASRFISQKKQRNISHNFLEEAGRLYLLYACAFFNAHTV